MEKELEKIKKKLIELKPYLAEKYNVSEIGIFGSFIYGEERVDSDIDIVVEFSKPIGLDFFELADFLEEKLGRKVDLMTKKSIRPAFRKYIIPNILPVI